MANVEVINGGMLSTIQDSGRYGYQEIGINVSGFADDYNARLANILVGNDMDSEVIEMAFLGSSFEFNAPMLIALTGADFSAKLNDEPIENYRSYLVKEGDELTLGAAQNGFRGYIAFGGEIDVPVVNGSKSTNLKTGMGGFEGRKLMSDDSFDVIVSEDKKERVLDKKYIKAYSKFSELRVVKGPQDDAFTDKGIFDFFNSGGYTVTKDFDRMGIRLSGSKIEHKESADIISDGTALGSIQVPSNGQPIILFVDRQTTGGYTKVGTIITADLHKLGKLNYKDKVIFTEVSPKEANDLARAYYDTFDKIKAELN
ncbi:5-oxoprolinase subunit C family protein [Anaerococcus urinomassiliensis]|uniref:5-oxoprolinase subunit C family protein n=1 Tax=Anaerococcus urinomassiliensis TaxID=1745712 RepID=UPI00093A5BD5|nr:biotin-dependent carboxyltransferase family protein [Anaerococcus urinomassiliensis]